MQLSEIQARGIFKIEIDLGECSDAWKGVHITLRELSAGEQLNLGASALDAAKTLEALLPKLIVSHDVWTEPGVLATCEQVAEEILKSGSLFMAVVEKWSKALPLVRKSAGKSETSEAP